jgi:hypothetical protein
MFNVFDRAENEASRRKLRVRQLRMLLMVLIMVAVSQLLTDFIPIPNSVFTMDDVAIVAALLLLAIVFGTVANWCCPACSKSLWRWFHPFYCPRCGTKLGV